MLDISASNAWREAFPGAVIGLLELSGLDNSGTSAQLNERKRATEASLRDRYRGFGRKELLGLAAMSAYDRYCKRFNKTYHVQLQLESIVLKGRSFPDVSPAVDAYYMTEVETLVLTAGHDVARLTGPIVFDVSVDGDELAQMNGTLKALRPGDMIMRDAGTVRCSVIYGQDADSPITPATASALYVAYAPAGVPLDLVERDLAEIEANIRLFSPQAVAEQRLLLRA